MGSTRFARRTNAGTAEHCTRAGQVGALAVEKILGGCAILEQWTGSDGSEGKSLFYPDLAAGAWKQVWVPDHATRPGGLKEKILVEEPGDGAVRFQGQIRLPNGGSYLDRTTLTPRPDGSARQHIQTSEDGGDTCSSGWVGIYEATREEGGSSGGGL